MGWFDEQIRERIQSDDESFSNAFASMSSLVMGKRITKILNENRARAKSAIDYILKYYHVKSLELPDSIKDINDQLEYLMRPSGIMRRTVILEGSWYKDAVGAMLGFRKDDGTPIALIPFGLTGYKFYDNNSGKWVRVNKKTASLIDDEAISFYKPLPLKKLGIKDLLKYIVQCMSVFDFVLVGLVTFATSLLGLLTPKIQRIIYGPVIEGEVKVFNFCLLFLAFLFV